MPEQRFGRCVVTARCPKGRFTSHPTGNARVRPHCPHELDIRALNERQSRTVSRFAEASALRSPRDRRFAAHDSGTMPRRHDTPPSTHTSGEGNQEGTIMSDTTTASADTAIRPFRIEVPQQEIDELRRRIDATRWPSRELVA